MGINKGYLTAKTDKASDEVFTPKYAVYPIIKYIKNKFTNPVVWCPFDKDDSNFVKCLKKNGCEVIATHIDNEQNFFFYEPKEHYDCIVSNPPFSIKDDIFKRLYELNKPYAMLVPLPTLQGEKRFKYLKGAQALVFDKRVQYIKNWDEQIIEKNPPFASMYLCKDMLSDSLILEELSREPI